MCSIFRWSLLVMVVWQGMSSLWQNSFGILPYGDHKLFSVWKRQLLFWRGSVHKIKVKKDAWFPWVKPKAGSKDWTRSVGPTLFGNQVVNWSCIESTFWNYWKLHALENSTSCCDKMANRGLAVKASETGHPTNRPWVWTNGEPKDLSNNVTVNVVSMSLANDLGPEWNQIKKLAFSGWTCNRVCKQNKRSERRDWMRAFGMSTAWRQCRRINKDSRCFGTVNEQWCSVWRIYRSMSFNN